MGPEEWTGKMAEFCGRMQEARRRAFAQLAISLQMLTEIAILAQVRALAEQRTLAHKDRKPERAHIS
jgi:hypothetical protein